MIIRDYNEDRVSIILNIVKPLSYKGSSWPNISFFGIYDGHGGNSCSDFLRDNLHQYIVKDPLFPLDPKKAILNGFEQAEKEFCEKKAQYNGRLMDRSGSCAIVLIIIDDMGYVANVGDSRAVISIDQGRIVNPLSRDHKPDSDDEKRRIMMNGGKVYQ
jgi:protein phosphatase 2C family protein 2/3